MSEPVDFSGAFHINTITFCVHVWISGALTVAMYIYIAFNSRQFLPVAFLYGITFSFLIAFKLYTRSIIVRDNSPYMGVVKAAF